MLLKILGAIMIISACGSVGFCLAWEYKREEKSLEQLINILDYMECELKYRLTPLPLLCRQAADRFPGTPGDVLGDLSDKMQTHSSADAGACMKYVLQTKKTIPKITKDHLFLMGNSIGDFDLEGQLKGLKGVRQSCKNSAINLSNNRQSRLRSYKTLGLCAGAALAILFI